ncbi:MAG: UDP-N-acetylmuramoyl-L-alanine--D-glutamate ligase, partial [Nitrospirae bacterium]|nr:UDP-N-acetylmuramoyl-L-alanine--D-glutamate ligase [Nitrospirota bacterium]
MDFRKKKVLVVGMGKSGVAAAQLLQREGAGVTITDMRSRKALGRKVYELERLGIIVEAGKHRPEFFNQAELIVVSPGVPMMMTPLDGAIRKGIPVIGEMELGFSFLQTPVMAVTGSNGKSTTTTLLGDILEASGKKVFVGGNLGTPLCQFVLSGERTDWVVVEVSSFQLETIRTFRPKVAVLLNVTPDHLDRYRDVQEYAEAKIRIFDNQTSEDFAVLNGDDPWTDRILSRIRPVPVLFSRRRRIEGGVFAKGESIISSV